MFPHTITIFGKQNADKTYPRTVIKGVLWYGSETFIISGKSIQNSDSINVIIPKVALKENNIPIDFKIEKGNRIVKGEVPNIQNSITELNSYENIIIVSSIDDNDFGSEIDSIVIGGK